MHFGAVVNKEKCSVVYRGAREDTPPRMPGVMEEQACHVTFACSRRKSRNRIPQPRACGRAEIVSGCESCFTRSSKCLKSHR